MTWTFFPRSDDPLCSVLLPCDGNPHRLLKAMDSAWSLAKDKTLIEFVLLVDKDDAETRGAIEGIGEKIEQLSVRTVAVGEGVAGIVAEARGDWILPFSDFAVMTTEHWDQRLLHSVENRPWAGIADVCLLRTNEPGFCFVRRETINLVSSYLPKRSWAGWLQKILEFVACCSDISVSIDCDMLRESIKFQPAELLPAIDLLMGHMNSVFDNIKWQKEPFWHGWYIRDDGSGERQTVYVGRDSTAYGLDGDEIASFSNLGKTEGLGGTWSELDNYIGKSIYRTTPKPKPQQKVVTGGRPTIDSVWQDRPDTDGWWWLRDTTKELVPAVVDLVNRRVAMKAIDGVTHIGDASLGDCHGEWTPVVMLQEDRHPRGLGPLVSVLLPSRGRPEMLRKCVNSFYENAYDPNTTLEILLKVDDDDRATIDVANQLEALGLASLRIGPRGNGYADLHNYIEQLAREAKGDWLYVFNDDASMTTPCWDSLLLNEYPHHPASRQGIAMLVTPIANRPNSNEFMFVRKKIYDLLGRYSPVPQLDTWMFSIGVMMQCLNYTPIKVEHKNDGMSDKTAVERRKSADATINLIVSPPSILGRIRDCITLLSYLEGFRWGGK